MTETRVCEACAEEQDIDQFRLVTGRTTNNGKPYRLRRCRTCFSNDIVKAKPPVPDLPTEAEMRDWYQKGCRI